MEWTILTALTATPHGSPQVMNGNVFVVGFKQYRPETDYSNNRDNHDCEGIEMLKIESKQRQPE
jgi:hypothetical protein